MTGAAWTGARERLALPALVLVAAVALSLLVTSGRLGTSDAGAQYVAAETLVTTGGPSRADQPGLEWLLAPNGRFYEVHNPGNMLLMAPAAALAVAMDRRADAASQRPPRIGAAAVSLTYALLAGIALAALFAALRMHLARPRLALVLTAAFVLTTLYGAYQKTAYDVLGATLLTCMALAAALRATDRVREGAPAIPWALMAGAAVAGAGAFRITWMPFLALALAGLLVREVGIGRAARPLVAGGLTMFLLVAPSLAYNELRTGDPLVPGPVLYYEDVRAGELRPQYAGLVGPQAHEELASGLLYLTVSPGKGLLFFSPVLLLALVGAARGGGRFRFGLPLLACAAYAVFIAWQPARPHLSWGPRYLLPIVPLLWLALAPALAEGLRGRGRAVAALLLALSLTSTAIPLLTAWNDDLVEYRVRPTEMWRPVDHEAALASIEQQVGGDGRYAGDFVQRGGPATREQEFPDLWWRNIASRSPATGVLGLLIGATLALLTAVAGRRAWQRLPARDQAPSGTREQAGGAGTPTPACAPPA